MLVFVNGVPRRVNSRDAKKECEALGISSANINETTHGIVSADTIAKRRIAVLIMRENNEKITIYFP
jgi:hypothetical protein